jgi:glycolate oxidase
LSKLSRILEIDPDNRIARVEPGVRNLAISEAAARYGLYYAPDPSSQIACSIGGNVAEYSGGVHCLKYGLTVHNVLGLKLLTIEGDELTIGGATLDSPGYDLLALFNGSEGMLGIVTEVTVRLLPIPATKRLILVAFASVEAAAGAVGKIIANGIIPGGARMMDARADRGRGGVRRRGLSDGRCGHSAGANSTARTTKWKNKRAGAAADAHATGDRNTRARATTRPERMWLPQRGFPAVGASRARLLLHGRHHRARLAEVLRAMRKLSEQFGLAVANVFHAGDGNLHPLILYDANARASSSAREDGRRNSRAVRRCRWDCHWRTRRRGKLDAMCGQFDARELGTISSSQSGVRPGRLMNPGKAVPTLARARRSAACTCTKGRSHSRNRAILNAARSRRLRTTAGCGGGRSSKRSTASRSMGGQQNVPLAGRRRQHAGGRRSLRRRRLPARRTGRHRARRNASRGLPDTRFATTDDGVRSAQLRRRWQFRRCGGDGTRVLDGRGMARCAMPCWA